MSFLPNPETVLLHFYQWAGGLSQASVIKQRFISHDMQLVKYQDFFKKLLDGFAEQFEWETEQAAIFQFYFLQFAHQLDGFNQKIHSYRANEQQVNWEVLARFHLPQLGRWCALLMNDEELSMDWVELLPKYDTQKQCLMLPVTSAMNWLLAHYGDSIDALASDRCEQFPYQHFKEKESVLRTLHHWKAGKLPDATTIREYFPDEWQLRFQSDNLPTMRQIRQRFLLARLIQAAFQKAHAYFSPNSDITSSDLHENKAWQLVYIGKYIFDLTVFSCQKFADEHCAEQWFEEQLGDYGKAVFASVLTSNSNDEIMARVKSQFPNLPENFSNKTDNVQSLTRYLMTLNGDEPLLDFFHIDPQTNQLIQQQRISIYQQYKRDGKAYLTACLALNPITAKAFGISPQPEKVIADCDSLTVIKGLLDSGLFLHNKKISRLLIERAEKLSQAPDDVLFVIKARLHRYLYTDQRRNDKHAAASVKQLLEQALRHPCAQFSQAQLLNYQARDALSRNDFAAAKQFYRQALDASKTGCYGDWRGRVGLDLLALETFDRKLVPNNHETYYRDMLAGGVFNCFIKVDLPDSLEDTVEELLLQDNHWETLYQPYYGFENQRIKMDKDNATIIQTFFKLISDEPFIEQKAVDWILQHKKILAKSLPSVEGGNPLMMLLKLISQLQKHHDIANQQEIGKMIFAMRRAALLLVKYAPESLNNRDFKQQNPLIFPSEWADYELIELMLQQGSRPDTLDYQGMTPLHAIIKTHSQACLDLMLAVNPDLTVKTTDGQTLLHTAAKVGNLYAVEILLKRQPELQNVRDCHDHTALEQAKRVLANSDYWWSVTSSIQKPLSQHHWQLIIDKLS
ncbi:ankyrin repeat domain-containing protein [Bisgaard Taxon 10/6]|uniref:ankyrin repeat domain-containing protein n=1 Tax=Exercitatus varius TaxID=67857 RepID=UPI00294AA727|nr:ankyrin repeat domain-containing protein [Exercitatus varius]MDG2914636.1 ankyrin repeat domain-containing protein [Exercitatus varius]